MTSRKQQSRLAFGSPLSLVSTGGESLTLRRLVPRRAAEAAFGAAETAAEEDEEDDAGADCERVRVSSTRIGTPSCRDIKSAVEHATAIEPRHLLLANSLHETQLAAV